MTDRSSVTQLSSHHRRTPFVGRQDDFKMLDRWYQENSSGLFTITGVPGVGKTRLLDEWLSQKSSPYLLVDLRGCFSELQLLEQVAAPFKIVLEEDLELVRLAEALDGYVLALDNAEHIRAEVRSFLTKFQFAKLHVLVTSREPLEIGGEIKHLLQPFDIHDRQTTSHASATAMVSYWIERHDLDFNNPFLERLLNFSAGIPLLIELLAGHAGQAGLETIAHLVDLGATAELRHRSKSEALHVDYLSALAWSCKLLEDDELEVLEHATMFNIEFSLEDCRWVLGKSWVASTVARCLLSLVSKNLLQLRSANLTSEPRFAWHVPIQSTMRGLLSSAEVHAFERRHTQWVVHRLSQVQEALISVEPHAVEAVRALLPEANFALERIKKLRGQQTLLVRLALTLVRLMYLFWMVEANYREAAFWLTMLEKFPSLNKVSDWILAQFYLAESEHELGLEDRSIQRFVDTIALARQNSSEHLALGLQNLAALLNDNNRHAEAIPLLEECFQLERQSNNEYGLSVALNSLAIALYSTGQVDRALELFEQRLIILRQQDKPFEIAFAALNFGVALVLEQQTSRAMPLVSEAFSLFQHLGDVEGQRLSQLALGNICLETDNPREALLHYAGLLKTEPILNSEEHNKAIVGTGVAYAQMGQVKVAIEMWVQAINSAVAYGSPDRIREVFAFLLDCLTKSSSVQSALLGLQLIGWYKTIVSVKATGLVRYQEELNSFQAECDKILAETRSPKKLRGSGVFNSNPDTQRRFLLSIARQLASNSPSNIPIVTARQLDVLRLVARGFSDKRIAKELGIAPRTVNDHMSDLFSIFNPDNRTELVLKAQEFGLIEPFI